ncbi:hypothetical protein AB4Y32_09810 [Paraburkholderia phymatum]|uniref:Uncharacterized protein n=1 Tax=Paraburkholderia phymatum TaxID=148447 RepID=A0ACC6TXK9_9BURK
MEVIMGSAPFYILLSRAFDTVSAKFLSSVRHCTTRRPFFDTSSKKFVSAALIGLTATVIGSPTALAAECDAALVRSIFSSGSTIHTDFRLAQMVSKEQYNDIKHNFSGIVEIYGVPIGEKYADYTKNFEKMLQITNTSLSEDLARNIAWIGLDPDAKDAYSECIRSGNSVKEGLHLIAQDATQTEVTVLVRWVPSPETTSNQTNLIWNLKSNMLNSDLPTLIHVIGDQRVVVKRPTAQFTVKVRNGTRDATIVLTPYVPPPKPPAAQPAFIEQLKTEPIAANCGAIGGNNCSGAPTVDKCVTVDSLSNVFEIATANIVDKIKQGSADAWITSKEPQRICARADASVGPGGTSSGVSGKISVMQRIWQSDPDGDLFRYIRRGGTQPPQMMMLVR